MKIYSNVSIKELNTFRVDVNTDLLIFLENDKDFFSKDIYKYIKKNSYLIVGGGSNILFTKDYKGSILLVKNGGKKIINEDKDSIEIEVAAGENWDSFVKWSVDNNLIGLQNLALIPGTVGATPIQNVGAYNTEVKDFITEVKIVNLTNEREEILTNRECNFKYRDSIFKHKLKNNIIVKSVTFRVPKYKGHMEKRYLEYSGIKEKIKDEDITPLSLYWAIVNIRNEKLPRIEEYGSCGSTFKNPVISLREYNSLLSKYPQLPKYDTNNVDLVKIPAAYILEKLGWKNRREGSVGTWIHHPLIVTNYGGANGDDILLFIREIQKDFKSNTGIDLECEINII